LRQKLIPFHNQHNKHGLFHHDNARPQQPMSLHHFLTQNNIITLPWLALSQNQNPIEQLWNRIDPDVRNQARKSRASRITWRCSKCMECCPSDGLSVVSSFHEKEIYKMHKGVTQGINGQSKLFMFSSIFDQ